MKSVIEKAKAKFFQMVDDFGSDPFRLSPHLFEAEKWANFMLEKYPRADKEVVLLSVWLHDLGHYPVPTDVDHAVRSEQRAKEFLKKQKCPKEKMDAVLHCVRAHRCRDVMPQSFEAKIVAFVDSASHMTGPMYLEMAGDDKQRNCELRVYEKIERDFRDLSSFPEIQSELKGLYAAWKKLIKAYELIDFK
jgi:hypothetical protein